MNQMIVNIEVDDFGKWEIINNNIIYKEIKENEQQN